MERPRRENLPPRKDFDWRFICIGLGFGVGNWMVMGPIIFWPRGRKKVVLQTCGQDLGYGNCMVGHVRKSSDYTETESICSSLLQFAHL